MKRSFCIPQRLCNDAEALVFRQDSPWLAPLAGYSDLPFRLLCREFGAVVCETEMLSAKGLIYHSPTSADLLQSAPDDAPLVVQLFGSDPSAIADAMLLLRKSGYTAFDFNLGCPVRKVMRQNCGAALLEKPEEALAVAKAMLAFMNMEDLAPAKTGFKLRLDAERKPGFINDLGRRLEDMGASWICLHPRTAREGYSGSAHWEEIGELTRAVSIPVIASGDLLTADKAAECLRATDASCVMYARGSLRNPWIFTQHIYALKGTPLPELPRNALKMMIEKHIYLARTLCGDKCAFAKMRSIIPRYVRNFRGVNELRVALCHCEDWTALSFAFERFMERSYESNPRK